MHLLRNLLLVKHKYLYGLLLLLSVSLICLAFSMSGSDDYDAARKEILLRRIGHEILLQSGDSTSQVLPVKRLTENEYQLSFANPFTFQPELLVSTTQRFLGNDPVATDYIVNVLNCSDASVVYGYAIARNQKDDIVSCVGRIQPKACYRINIKFKPGIIANSRYEYLFGSLLAIVVIGFVFMRKYKPREATTELAGSPERYDLPEESPVLPESPDPIQTPQSNLFNLGSIVFDTDARRLIVNGTTIDLTKTETRVLRIFAMAPNEAIERSRLQKEIWEDDGVIVGRSLDMFISKLRKKLESDPSIKISVIRGKGYKLEIGA